MPEHVVEAPVPGTFYRRPDPDADPYAEPGDTVEEGKVIGIIEVMKQFYDVEVEQAGTIAEFLVENEASVEAGQPIAKLT